jgi:hypothetical protein
MANPLTDFLTSLETSIDAYRVANNNFLLEMQEALRQLADDLDEIPGPEPPDPPDPEPEPPAERSIFGWNAGLAIYWANSRPFKNKALYASIHKQGNATFDKYGDLVSGNGLLPIWMSRQMAKPGRYTVNIASGGSASRSSFVLEDRDGIQQFNITINGDCTGLSVLRDDDIELSDVLLEPEFRARHTGAAAIRLMDLRRTNEGDARNGNHFRVEPGSTPIIEQTVTPFYAIAMAEECGGTPIWWNFHHLDSDEFITEVCRAFEAYEGSFPIYFEMSNEVWGPFPVGAWADAIVGKPEGRYEWQNQRTRRMSAIAKSILGDRAKIVIGSQCVNFGVTQKVLAGGIDGIDCLAIAPYFSYFQAPPTSFGDAITKIRQYMELEIYPAILGQKDLADNHGLRLLGYEAGSHLSWLNNESLQPLYSQLDESNEMASIYEEFCSFWKAEVNDVCLFYNDLNHHGFGHFRGERLSPQPRGSVIMERIHA